MPSRNVLKVDTANSYYHVYARGAGRQAIFKSPDDYAVFLNLFKRYLSEEVVCDNHGVQYPHLRDELELLCYCLMPNHFHMLLYQIEQGSMQRLMRSVMTSYSRYFNKKYKRSGPLFESRYKASMILNDAYLEHISRYIHLNPRDWDSYAYSSLPYYVSSQTAEWLHPNKILALFVGPEDYRRFVEDYEEHKKMLDEIKGELANVN